jgi:hypothetical protein
MSFLIAAAALAAALVAGVLLAPQPFRHPTLGVDVCWMGAGAWGMSDPGCSDLRIGGVQMRQGIESSPVRRRTGSRPEKVTLAVFYDANGL